MKYFAISVATLFSLTFLPIQMTFGDDDHEEHSSSIRKTSAVSVKNSFYQQECASCHFAYPPGLLPEQSWKKIMSTLDQHFGENAEMIDSDRIAIEEYLISNSADKSNSKRSKKFRRSLSSSTVPLRITELRYFKHEHDEIPNRMVKDNPKVRSFSQCDSCHRDAKDGHFRESKINIPGYGRWDD
ncbi:diheme cytochrome c [Kaarinaea lacus]